MAWIILQVITGTLVASIAIAGWLYLARAERKSRRPVEAEHGLTPSYVERGGARFGGLNWSIPFVRIATYRDFVVVSCATHEIVLHRGEVTGIERERHLWSQGLRLHHARPGIPDELILWPRHTDRLEAALRASLLT